MASIKLPQLLLCLCLAAFASGSGITTTDKLVQPTPVFTGDTTIISSYQSVFSSLARTQPWHRGPGKRGPNALCNPCASCIDGCEGWAKAPPPNSLLDNVAARLASAGENQDFVAASSAPTTTSGLKSVSASTLLPYTAQRYPSRTTIYQALSTQSTLPEHASANEDLTSSELKDQLDSEGEDPSDITQDYYLNILDGHASSVIPIIVQDDNGTPVTLLAYAKTVFTFNLISTDLVEQLNLTHRVKKVSSLSAFDPYNDFELMSGRIASIAGVISLDLVAGLYDSQVSDAKFLVFKPVTDAKQIKPEVQGKLQPDIYAGVDLLYRAGALTLSDDFVGVTPKEGLGIVVQKVFSSISSSKEQGQKEPYHGEL